MKVLDAIEVGLKAYANARKGDLTEEQLNVDLATDTLEDGTTLEYEALEVGKEVFEIVEGEDPKAASDKEYALSDDQMIVVADGKISEIKPKEEEKEVEMSEEQKKVIELAASLDVNTLNSLVDLSVEGYHTIEFSVIDGMIQWADMYSNTVQALLSDQTDPLKVELETEKGKVTDLEAKIVVLQELADEKEKETNPLKKETKLEEERPLTRAEIIKENIKNAQNL